MPKRIFEKNINTPERYDEIYDVLRIDYSDEECQSKRNQMIFGLKDGMKVVELGCGNSSLLINIKRDFPNCEVHGLDFSKRIIDFMREKTVGIEFKLGNSLNTGYKDKYFDYVLAGELIEHTEKPEELIKEMVRISKGVISVSTPLLETSWRDPYAEHLWEFDREDIINLLEPYGEVDTKFFFGKGRHMVATCHLKNGKCI
jgi:ubiquinone/menaquinone biosynthesis C-methylase UbiE